MKDAFQFIFLTMSTPFPPLQEHKCKVKMNHDRRTAANDGVKPTRETMDLDTDSH